MSNDSAVQNTSSIETGSRDQLGTSGFGADAGPLTTNGTTPELDASTQGPWKTHVDNQLGLEVQYPPNWEVTVKTDRFETGPDLKIEEVSGFDSFGVTTVEDMSGEIIDTELFATFGQDQLAGEEAYTFTYTQGSGLGGEFSSFLEAVQEVITVIHDGTGYILAFSGMTSSFDDPENAEIRERMLNSIRFLDEGGSDVNNEDVSAEVDDEENDDDQDEGAKNNDGDDSDANIFN